MCYLQSCCCGCTLRKGTLIIGYLSLVIAALGLIGLITIVVELRGELDTSKTSFIIVIFCVVIANNIASIFLIIGATKGRRQFMVPWIILDIIGLMLIVISFFITGESNENSSESKAAGVISKLVGLAGEAYCICVVVSHHRELKIRDKTTNAPISA